MQATALKCKAANAFHLHRAMKQDQRKEEKRRGEERRAEQSRAEKKEYTAEKGCWLCRFVGNLHIKNRDSVSFMAVQKSKMALTSVSTFG